MERAEARDRELRELLFLQQLAVAAASTMERDELLDLIIRQTTGAMETDVCALYLYDAARSGLVLTATNGLNQDAVGKAVMRLEDGITGKVASTRSPLAVAEVATDPHFKWIEGVDEMRFTSMLSVPIEAGPRMVGVLNVQTVERRDFRPDELAFLSAIAGALAGVLERAELQRRLEDQLEEIQLSQTVHEKFTSLVLSGAGLGKIVEAISTLAGGEVGLHDPLGFRLEHDAGSGLAVGRIIVPSSLAEASGPVEAVHPRPRIELTLTPVRAGSELIAVLAMEGRLAAASAGRRRALEHGATVVALELLKERAAAEVERRLRGDLLEGLLASDQDPGEAGRLAARAERLGYRIPEMGWVVVLEPDDEESAGALQSAPIQERVQRDLTELCRPRFPGSMVLGRVTSTVLVVPAEPARLGPTLSAPNLAEMESFARSIQDLLRGISRGVSVSIGIGNLANSTHELARAHEEARQALRLARRGGAAGRVSSYRSLGALRLLLEVRDPTVIRRFVDETLGPLLEYGQHHRTPLLATLEALATHGWNQRATAKALRIHINTLTYRVQRLEALLGVGLDDAELRVVLGIALQARGLQLG